MVSRPFVIGHVFHSPEELTTQIRPAAGGWIYLAQYKDWWRVVMNTVLKALYDPGEACSTNWGEESCIQGFSGETWGKETTWKTQA